MKKTDIDIVKEFQEQAEAFGLELDLETLELREPQIDPTPQWLKSWREKLNLQDINYRFDFDEPERRE